MSQLRGGLPNSRDLIRVRIGGSDSARREHADPKHSISCQLSLACHIGSPYQKCPDVRAGRFKYPRIARHSSRNGCVEGSTCFGRARNAHLEVIPATPKIAKPAPRLTAEIA